LNRPQPPPPQLAPSPFSSGPSPTVEAGFGGPAPGDSLDVQKYLRALRQRWYLVAVCVLVALGLAFVRHTLTPKVFRASTVIQIERKRLISAAMGRDTWLENWWNLEYYPTQYRLLRSRGMAERVVIDLRLYEDPAFTGGAPIDLPDAPHQALADPGVDHEVNAELARLGGRLQGGLSVNPIQETQLVELAYESHSPELAAQIANGYAQAFIDWGVRSRKASANLASAFLTEQIEALSQDIEAQRRKLGSYSRSSDLDLDPAGELMVERREALERQYNEAVADHLAKEVAYREILNLPGETVADRFSSGGVGRLRSEIRRLQAEYDSQLEVYRREWPAMVELEGKIDSRRRELADLVEENAGKAREEAYAALQKAKLEKETLEEALRELNSEALELGSEAIEYNNLKTVIRTRQDLLNDLVKRQSETEVASQIQDTGESNVRVVDRAIVPTAPIRPILRKDLTLAFGAGLLLGVALIALLEYLDRTIKQPEELEALVGLPTLTVIPDLAARSRKSGYSESYGYSYGYGAPAKGSGKSGRILRRAGRGSDGEGETPQRIELLPHHNPRLAICEAYRSLRTALLLSSAEELKSIAVTSAESGEGKTATASNLSVVMAQLGQRVLIVDGDLRRPRLHKVFGVSNRAGLVGHLTRGAELEQVVLETRIPNLWVCPSGPIPPNPSELLSSERMREFVKAARTRFDFVVLDGPPVLPVADAVILGTLVDGLVLCAGAGQLTREGARACRERLSYGNLKIFGTVLNRHREEPAGYRKSGRYYTAYQETPSASSETSAA